MEHYGSTLVPEDKQKAAQRGPGFLPVLTLIAHPDTTRIGEICPLPGIGSALSLSRVGPDFTQPGQAWGKPLADPFLSRSPILFTLQTDGSVQCNRRQCKTHFQLVGHDDATDYVIAPESLHTGINIVLAERIVLRLHIMRYRTQLPHKVPSLVGFSDGVLFLREEIAKVADLDTPVLLRGASGTGKELVAQAIHDFGKHKSAFISVNMGAILPNLAASELFGAVKGSFTGAERNQEGYFRAAQGGTLFLDEIGEAQPEIQVMMLRALESGEISPVGAQKPIRIQTRLIAATDADLEHKMAHSSFKTPLFHRLAGYEIRLPPLTERLEDFGRLFMHFARIEMAKLGTLEQLKPTDPTADPWMPADLMVRLLTFHWPGNIRQLRNLVRQLVIGCRGEPCLRLVPKVNETLGIAQPQPIMHAPPTTHLPGINTTAATIFSQEPGHMALPQASPSPPLSPTTAAKRRPSDISREELLAAMQQNRWDLQATADTLGISRSAIYLLIDQTPGVKRATELTEAEIQEALTHHAGDEECTADTLRISVRALRRRMKSLGLR